MKTRQTASDRMLEEVKRSVFQYALFRPESAIVIALSILCAGASLVFPWFPGAWWLWLGFGALGEGALVLSTLKDEKFHRWVMDRLFRERERLLTDRPTPEMRSALALLCSRVGTQRRWRGDRTAAREAYRASLELDPKRKKTKLRLVLTLLPPSLFRLLR